MKANAPDWWGALPPKPTGLTEDRYVSAVEIKEISARAAAPVASSSSITRSTHWSTQKGAVAGTIGSPHEVGRNAEILEPEAAYKLKAGAQLLWPSVHMHANAEDTTAHLQVGYKFHPEGYKPKRRMSTLTFGNGEIDLRPMTAGQEIHFYPTLQNTRC